MFAKLSTEEELQAAFHGENNLDDDVQKHENTLLSIAKDAVSVGKILYGVKDFATAVRKQCSQIPLEDPLSRYLTGKMVDILWGSMLHPPVTYLGAKFTYRAADGSHNSALNPEMGKAGLPYAKTVPSQRPGQGARPDPGDLFDMLMARDEEDPEDMRDSALGISSVLLYHATIIIHDIFRTNMTDKNISDTSSYLDLSPLYGRSREIQESVRAMSRGLLKPDSFAEERLLNQPSGVNIYLIMYNRFHNYVAKQLLEINENGRFYKPYETQPKDWNEMTPWDPPSNSTPPTTHSNAKLPKDTLPVWPHGWSRPHYWTPPTDWRPSTPGQPWEPTYSYVDPNKTDDKTKRPIETTKPLPQDDETWAKFVSSATYLESRVVWNVYRRNFNTAEKWLTYKVILERIPGKEELWNLRQAFVEQKLDEDLFQTARLVTCGMYINISVHDYLKVLMQLHPENTAWTLDPRKEIPGGLLSTKEQEIRRGIGNQVSAEFNLLYRFHSPISRRDTKWSESFLAQILDPVIGSGKEGGGGMSAEELQFQVKSGKLDIQTLKLALMQMYRQGATTEQKAAMPFFPPTFGEGYKREEDGHFSSDQLAEEIIASMQDPICQFGARNVPKFFRSIEMLGILQSRKWEVATLNEFRSFFGMSKHTRFEDINTSKDIQNSLRDLYDNVDLVELYPGLMVEGNGRNLDPGTTGPNGSGTALWRGVFSDAVTLVRSDRFYTTDWNVGSLTAWGMKEVTYDPTISKGSVMHRLFQRAFPGTFKFDSLHLWQPFYTPAMNYLLAREQGLLAGLQDPCELGLPADWKQRIEKQKASGWLDHEAAKDFKTLQSQESTRYFRKPDLKDLLIMRKDNYAKFEIQLEFLQLKQIMKMRPVKRFAAHRVADYGTIKEVLGDKSTYRNPAYSDATSIPSGPLRDILSGLQPRPAYLAKAQTILNDRINKSVQETFFSYIISMSKIIRLREQRKFQKINKTQILEIDIVKDFAIPVVTRFIADFFGFGDSLKNTTNTTNDYDENTVYRHFTNCQDYAGYDSDETKCLKRRQRFRDSIAFLTEQSKLGVLKSKPHLSEKIRGDLYWVTGENEIVVEVKKCGIRTARQLRSTFPDITDDQLAAVNLAFMLRCTQRIVLLFTECLDFLLLNNKQPDGSNPRWQELQSLAFEHDANSTTENNIKKYVLEAIRLRVDLQVARKVDSPTPKEIVLHKVDDVATKKQVTIKQQVRTNDLVVLDIQKASQDPTVFPNPKQFSIDRPAESYLVYGNSGRFDPKQLTLLVVTGMVKYCARLCRLRIAHDVHGELKTATSPLGPEGPKRYMSITWDALVPFPATWHLRFNQDEGTDGESQHIDEKPLVDSGHGMDQVWAPDHLSS